MRVFRPFLLFIAVAVLLVGAGTMLAVAETPAAGLTPSNVAEPMPTASASAAHCIMPTPFMRRNHMKLLMHDRRMEVHDGVRIQGHNLEDCMTCHVVRDAQGEAVPITDSRHFCNKCHASAAVSIDCFSCHRSTPEPTSAEARR